ncbi:TadE/TadG family type IV pilus assembly protein [Octadecabacter ascidiaceicola]|nr:TadE/TadG family type IV pilus assembly protein [Octadecabacter ascidiaceicola]
MKKLLSAETSLRGLFRKLHRDEDGSIIIFSLMMFVLILWFGGMAVDLMRFETTRAKLQGTLDRAVLAAADLDQVLPPAEVCADYFEKAGMSQFLDTCTVDQGINYRVVTAVADAEMPLFFYDLPSVFSSPFSAELSSLTVSGTSTAEERVTDVEVSLVLDVSSSMDQNNRIQNLRPAARDFVSTVLANNTNAPKGLITISIVPYSAVVNPGPQLEPHFPNVNRVHEHSMCLLFDASEFTSTALDLNGSYNHVAHFGYNGYGNSVSENPWCFAGTRNAIIPHTTDEDRLHTAIENLHAFGNTAIDMGVKWGVALLDPSTRSIITDLAGTANSGVPAIASGRPENFGQSDVLKILVLMTDGQNTSQWDLVEPFKTGLSFVWYDLDSDTQPLQDAAQNGWSVQYRGFHTKNNHWDDRFYWNGQSNNSRFRSYPMGFSNRSEYITARTNSQGNVLTVGQGPTYQNSVRNASWQELFAIHFTSRVNDAVLRDALNARALPYRSGISGRPDFIDPDYALNYSIVNGNQANARLSAICDAARNEGVVIYTVAFEAPTGGQEALRDCASTPSHYFDVAGTDISDAFSAIASDIRALKLTR